MMRRRIVRLVGAFALAALFLSGLQTPSLADMTVTQEVTTTLGGKKTTHTQTLYWTKSKARAGMPSGGIVIMDLDTKTFTILNIAGKTYTKQSFEDLKKAEASLPAEMREMKLSVSETGEKKTIDGYPCEKLSLKMGPTEITVWITKKIAIDPAVTEFNKKLLELTKDIKTLAMQARMQAEFEKRKAYPYLTVIEIPLPFAGKTQRMESKVKKVSYEKIAPSVFAIPTGYKKMVFPGMPPGR